MAELHGIAMLRVFKAIERLEKEKKLAVSSRIAEIVGKPITCQLILYWRYGNLSRKPVKTTRNKKRKAGNCSWYYYITAKGYKRYRRLIEEFGDIIDRNNSVLQVMAPGEIQKDIINSVPPEISAAPSLGDMPLKQVK